MKSLTAASLWPRHHDDRPHIRRLFSDHHRQEASSLCGQLHRTALLPAGPGPGLLLHQRGPRGEAGVQDHHTAVHLRPAADPQGHPPIHGGQPAHDR